jgi:hypothetical protein
MSKLHDVPEYVWAAKSSLLGTTWNVSFHHVSYTGLTEDEAQEIINLLNERDQLMELVKKLEYNGVSQHPTGDYNFIYKPPNFNEEQHALIQQIQEKPDE